MIRVRPIDEILADMQAIMDKPDGQLTADDILTYQGLELELAQAQEANAPDEADEGETPGMPEPPPAAPASRARVAINAMRERHAAYTRPIVPAGRPGNRSTGSRRPETEMDGFRAYLRTGRPNADMTPSPQNAQGTGSGSGGGFLVPEEFMNRIVDVIKTFGGVFNDAEQLATDNGRPMPFPTNDDTSNEGVVATEGNAPASGADLSFGQVELGAFEYAASGTGGSALKVPVALVQDSAIDIEAFVAKRLGTRIARKMARDAVSGTGTGQAQGVLQNLAGNATGTTTLTYDDLVSLVTGHVDPYYWTNAKWYMSAGSFGTVMELEDGSSQLIFRPGLVMIGDGQGTQISNRIQVGPVLAPVVVDPAFADFGASAKWAIFGDLSEGYIWRTVRQVEVLVNPYTSANERQIEYNAWVRADGRQKNTAAYAVSIGHA